MVIRKCWCPAWREAKKRPSVSSSCIATVAMAAQWPCPTVVDGGCLFWKHLVLSCPSTPCFTTPPWNVWHSALLQHHVFFFSCFFHRERRGLGEGAHILLPPRHLKTKHLKYKEGRECPKQDALCFAIRVRSQIQARLAWSPLSSAQCTQRNASSMQFAVGCFWWR